MDTYVLFLGHASRLATLEVQALAEGAKMLTDSTLRITCSPQTLQHLEMSLGGTVKIARMHKKVAKQDSELEITKALQERSVKNVAVSDYAKINLTPQMLKGIKAKLTGPIRFLSFTTSDHELIAVKKQHVLEINILPEDDELLLAETVWVHDAQEWARRDRKKPYRAVKKGMLPPKIARMMVNLAMHGKKGRLADPFCGTGTIPMEALLVGCEVMATDIDARAAEGAHRNLSWLVSTYNLTPDTYNLAVADATHLHEKASDLDAIVTEPFLGPLIEQKGSSLTVGGTPLSPTKRKNIITGVNKLYIGALKSWHKALKPRGRVVMIVPEWHLRGEKYTLPLIDTCENLGYNRLAQLPYGKSGATVIRNITILEKT